MLEQFVSFAKGLSSDRREAVEAALAALMESYSDKYGFTGDELAQLDERAGKTDPQFADPEEITRLLGKPFSA